MRKVAILAMGGTVSFSPFRDADWEIWAMPWQVLDYPRVDRFFEPHTQWCVEHSVRTGFREGAWIKSVNDNWPDVPVWADASRVGLFKNGVEYPQKEVEDFLPIPFLENTVAYMIALALYERVEHIGLYGIHMMGHREYEFQRPCITYLVGLALGMGMQVTIPDGSPLFMSGYVDGRYGINDTNEGIRLLGTQAMGTL